MTGPASVVSAATFSTRNPATGEVVGTYRTMDADDVAAALDRARAAAAWWRGLGFDGRRRRLQAWRAAMARRAADVAALMHDETGKPEAVGFLEVMIGSEHLSFAARHAGRVLGERRVRASLATFTQAPSVRYVPLGVVAVVTPWNLPFAIPVSDLASVLGAGNAALLKPSERATATAAWLADRFAEVVDGRPVLQLVTGDGSTGAALVASGVDKVAFTGSVGVGRGIARACAESLTPVSLELGGKDALVVLADADLDAAVEGATFGAFWNSGQLCIAVERAYVDGTVHDEFVRRLVERLRGLRCGAAPDALLGPMTLPDQVEVVRAHLADALERGARPVLGGLEAVRPPYVEPTVLVDVPEEARIMREESFGPVLPVARVAGAAEAVARANTSEFALGAAVFSRGQGMDVARRLRAGGVAVNSVLWFYASPRLPFGGRGSSGLGVVHGPDGLRNFTAPQGITRQRVDLGAFAFDRLPLHPRVRAALPAITRALYGRAPRRR